jgi:UDP-2-acetamido-3-amino-2,3-dideoxy-glucuronate N-acetyltransferase
MPRAVNPDMSLKSADDWVLSETRISAGAAIGANSTIRCGITVGRWAMIGAGSVVTKNVGDYELVVGNPARHSGWMSTYGHKLKFDTEGIAECPESKERYKLENNHVIPLP